MSSPDPFGLIGQVLDGHFRVERGIGEGGFSIVYKGTHVGLSEPIAIKCLKLPAALGSAVVESFVRRFRDESRLQYKLSQGNLHIVRSIASGTTIAPATSALVPYTVLEWLEGRSLAADFAERQARRLTGRSLDETIRLLDSAVDALAYAHSQGVVHRDLNPGNLFVARTPSGIRVKVLDFGVAKVMADSALAMGPSARTFGNLRMFAPAYGAPEQFDERIGTIGPWTDVYAAALVILEALRDAPVMEGEHLGDYAARALDPIRPTPRTLGLGVGDAVEAVFAHAVALAPTQRPRDAGEFWGMLKNAVGRDARGGSGRPASAVAAGHGQTVRMSDRPPVRTAAVDVITAGAAARGGTLRVEDGVWGTHKAPHPTPRPAAYAIGPMGSTEVSPLAATVPALASSDAPRPGLAETWSMDEPAPPRPSTPAAIAPPPAASRRPVWIAIIAAIVAALCVAGAVTWHARAGRVVRAGPPAVSK